MGQKFREEHLLLINYKAGCQALPVLFSLIPMINLERKLIVNTLFNSNRFREVR